MKDNFLSQPFDLISRGAAVITDGTHCYAFPGMTKEAAIELWNSDGELPELRSTHVTDAGITWHWFGEPTVLLRQRTLKEGKMPTGAPVCTILKGEPV